MPADHPRPKNQPKPCCRHPALCGRTLGEPFPLIGRLPFPLRLLTASTLLLLLAAADILLGPPISLSLLYTFPVLLAVWTLDRNWALIFSVLATAVSTAASLPRNSRPVLDAATLGPALWNSAMLFGYLLLLSSASSALRENLMANEVLANTDPLTGIANRRAFLEVLQTVLRNQASKPERSPLSLAWIDLDNFKAVNDRLGHIEGDHVLRTVGAVWSRHLRATDLIARMGGDEFCVLLLDTPHDLARRILQRAKRCFEHAMRRRGWDITCSVGLVTAESPVSANSLLRVADNLLYEAKREGRNLLKAVRLPLRRRGRT